MPTIWFLIITFYLCWGLWKLIKWVFSPVHRVLKKAGQSVSDNLDSWLQSVMVYGSAVFPLVLVVVFVVLLFSVPFALPIFVAFVLYRILFG